MAHARDERRCALQVLYQLDVTGGDDPELVRGTLVDSPGSDTVHEIGFRLALDAWATREDADAAVSVLSPDWPTHRQPVLDRNILRLAFHEMVSGRTPPKVAIAEAVELAHEFSTERSGAFVNGILDKIYRDLRAAAGEPIEDETADDETVGPGSIDDPPRIVDADAEEPDAGIPEISTKPVTPDTADA